MRTLPGTRDARGIRRLRWAGGLVLVASAALAGCSGRSDALPAYQVYDVKGKVLLADGTPLSGGLITLVPKGDLPVSPSGEIGPDGTFSIVTGGSGQGAPAGEYKVRIETPQIPRAKNKKPLVPPKYNDEDSSNLAVTVRAESNQLEPIRLR
jgi:hypothetical protein